jgi:hypothetical protein
MFALSGKVPMSMLGLPYVLLAFLARMLPKGFTCAAICGMNEEVTGQNRCPNPPFPFPTYYPDTGTGSDYLDRTLVEPLAQPHCKQASPRLTPLHTCDHAYMGASRTRSTRTIWEDGTLGLTGDPEGLSSQVVPWDVPNNDAGGTQLASQPTGAGDVHHGRHDTDAPAT